MTNWYYVEGKERIGPITVEAMGKLFSSGELDSDSYVWKKGFEDWAKANCVAEFKSFLDQSSIDLEVEEEIPLTTFSWENINHDERIFTIKIGFDRGGEEATYGPFSLVQLQRAFLEKRINGKTLVFATGMENWTYLADFPDYKELFSEIPPIIDEDERRKYLRKPFVARILFHNERSLYEGICRDISIGGLQVLVSGFPGSLGDRVKINVHPDNSDYCFVATAEIARILEGDQGVSLRFCNLNDSSQKVISEYVYNH